METERNQDEIEPMNTITVDIHAAFEHGWHYGRVTKQHPSPNEADPELRRHGLPVTPCTEIAFCNGADDGVAGDRWRLDGCCRGAMER